MTVGQVQVVVRDRVFALYLGGGGRKQVDVHGVMETSRADVAANVAREVRARVARVGVRVRVRGRYVGRRKLRTRG